MKGRVLIVGPTPPPQGGVASVIHFILLSELAKEFELLHLDISRKEGHTGAGIFSVPNLLQFFRQTARLLTMIVRYKPAVVHLPVTSGWSFWKEAVFYVVCKAMRRKILLHLHGGGFMDFFCHSSRLTQAIVRIVFSRADSVIVLSETWRRFLLEWVTKRPPICIISNSVSPELVQALRGDCPERR